MNIPAVYGVMGDNRRGTARDQTSGALCNSFLRGEPLASTRTREPKRGGGLSMGLGQQLNHSVFGGHANGNIVVDTRTEK
jgi:hypothetical protein